jgi:serralysin
MSDREVKHGFENLDLIKQIASTDSINFDLTQIEESSIILKPRLDIKNNLRTKIKSLNNLELAQTEVVEATKNTLERKVFSNDLLVSIRTNTKISPLTAQENLLSSQTQSNAFSIKCGCLLCQGSSSRGGVGSPSAAPGIYYIDALLAPGEPRWNDTIGTGVTVTYSFLTGVPDYYGTDASERNNFIGFNADQIDGARRALQLWSEVSGINFVEVSDDGGGGQIRFGTANLGSGIGAWGYYPSGDAGGDVWLNNLETGNLTQTNGSYGFQTMIHEIGHALGLKHPGNYDAGGGGTPGPYLPTGEDNRQYTVMSYFGHPNMFVEPQTPMLYDIAAIQYLYGANSNTRTGDDFYWWDSNTAFVQTIWDAGGVDTISAANQTLAATINLYAGTFSSIGSQSSGSSSGATSNLAIAFGVTIENAIGGSGNDAITGNWVANNLSGGWGNDSLYGDVGNDTLNGGNDSDFLGGWSENDWLVGESGNDFLYGDSGIDTLDGGDGDDLLFGHTDNQDVINTLGIDDNTDYLYAGTGNDTVYGGNGSDFLGGWSENDWLVGESGNDSLYGDSGIDTLDGGDGDDLLFGHTDNQDVINTLGIDDNTDYLYAGTGNDTAYGGNGSDFLGGWSENDWLVGESGNDSLYGDSGVDTLIGGDGNDLLFGHTNNQDVINTLGLDINTDYLYGGAGNDLLNGGAGNDQMIGDLGNDVYVVNSRGDVVIEALNQGRDTVVSAVSKTLAANLENLTLMGTANLNGVGNALNNRLTGNRGNNLLNGRVGNDLLNGGTGNDQMIGGLGNDILYGGVGKDRIVGGNGNDSINGGLGKDILVGGLGSDRFVVGFGTSLSSGFDRIVNFAIGSDKIDLLTKGGLALNAPRSLTRAANLATSNLTSVINSVFKDANGALAGNQALGINSAALIRTTGGAVVQTYMIINDAIAGFQSNSDTILNITGYTGVLPGLGSIAVNTFFA